MRKRWPLFLFIELLQQRLPVLWEVWAWFAALAQKVRPDRITVNALPTLTATVWAWFLLVCFFFFDTGNMAIIEIIKNFKWYLYKWFLNGENQIYWNNFQIHSTMQKLSYMIQVQVNILRPLRCHRNFIFWKMVFFFFGIFVLIFMVCTVTCQGIFLVGMLWHSVT